MTKIWKIKPFSHLAEKVARAVGQFEAALALAGDLRSQRRRQHRKMHTPVRIGGRTHHP